jgi:hypothetical protein
MRVPFSAVYWIVGLVVAGYLSAAAHRNCKLDSVGAGHIAIAVVFWPFFMPKITMDYPLPPQKECPDATR